MIETGIERIESTSHSEVLSQQVEDRVEQLEQTIERRPQAMKKKMILPIVQLRGNGTVGSGVVTKIIE